VIKTRKITQSVNKKQNTKMVTAMQKLLQVLLVFSVAFLKSSLSFPFKNTFKERLLKLDNLPCHAEALKVCILLVNNGELAQIHFFFTF
jgi:hypothetical protein